MSLAALDSLSRLVNYLKKRHAADLAELTPRQQRFVAKLALLWFRGNHQHHVFRDACAITWQSVREGGFRESKHFQRFNCETGWFVLIGRSQKHPYGVFSKEAAFARGYKLARPDVVESVSQFLRLDTVREKPFTDIQRRRKRKPPPAIVSKDSEGQTRKSRGQLKSSLVAVDEIALIQARERFQHPADYRKLHALDSIVHESRHQGIAPGHLIQQYRECASGRLMGISDGIHLQTAPREIRNIALNGQWDFDLEACHLRLMFEISRTHGTRLRSLEHAIFEKQKFREDMAQRHAMTVAEVKKAIAALSYGAAMSLSPYRAFRGDIFQQRTDEEVTDILPGFFGDIEVRSLVQDVKVAHHIILSTRHVSRKRTGNVLGKFIAGKPQTLVSHIVTGFEALALDIAIQRTGGYLSLLAHDGFVSPVQIDTAPIVQQFEQSTGLRIRYETNQLCCNAV